MNPIIMVPPYQIVPELIFYRIADIVSDQIRDKIKLKTCDKCPVSGNRNHGKTVGEEEVDRGNIYRTWA